MQIAGYVYSDFSMDIPQMLVSVADCESLFVG